MNPSAEPRRSIRGLRRWLLSVAVSVALLAYLLQEVDATDILETILDAHRWSLLLFVGVSLAGLLARVARYRLLLEHRVDLGSLTLVTLVRNCIVDLLPARLGSLSFVYLSTTRLGVPLGDSISCFFLALVFDMVAIAPLLLIAVLVVGGAVEGGAVALLIMAGALLAVSIVAIAALAPSLGVAAAILRRCAAAGWIGRVNTWERVAAVAEDTAEQVRAVRRRGVLMPVLLVSLLVRIFKFGAYYVLLQAVLLPHGFAWGSLDVFEVFLGVAGAELSATLPIHGIAGLGTYEAAWALGFTRLGFTQELALLSGFATHLISQAYDYGLGLAALVWIMRPGFRRATVLGTKPPGGKGRPTNPPADEERPADAG